ncbi:MAG: UDP-3-O-(3-hydroxymyristoyl)glucosamine N-acyltransferase [Planctomycetota bacterium]
MSITASELAERIGAQVRGDASTPLSGANTIDAAGPTEVTFLANRRYFAQLGTTAAGAIVVSPTDADNANGRWTGDDTAGRALLVAEDPYFAFRQAMVAMLGFRDRPAPGVHPSAFVDPAAAVGENCTIGPFCYVGPGATLGDGCVLWSHVSVLPGATLGQGCDLYPHVTVYDRCVLGDRVRLHAGCSIGQDGFGYATHGDNAPPQHHKIPPAGNAVVEDDVEMGAGCSIDRATMGSTVIGAGSKFSNGVTVAHGCRVGKCNLFVAQVGLAGSVTTGNYVVMGGQVGVAGHLTIADRVQVAAKAGVVSDLTEVGAQYGGQPARELSLAKRQILMGMRLPDIASDVKKLKRDVKKLMGG